MNNFKEDLIYSLEENYNDTIDSFYYNKFPHLKNIIIVEDLNLQKRGIDKILVLDSGKEIMVDEKKRRKDYGDILLEEYSNFEKKKKGWLARDKYTDYITYIITESNTIYLLPFLILQIVWIKNYTKWLNKYGRKFAPNIGYKTSNIPIPTNILLDEIKKQMVCKLWPTLTKYSTNSENTARS